MRDDTWPYDQQWNVTVEHDWGRGFASRVSYVGSKGTHWPVNRNINTPFPSTEPFDPNRRPFGPEPFSNVNLDDLGGNSTYHGLELELTRQFSRGIYLRWWWDYKRSLNDVQGGLFGTISGYPVESPYDRKREKGWQDGVASHRYRFVTLYEIPVGRERAVSDLPGWMNQIIGDWGLAGNLFGFWKNHQTPLFSGVNPANTGQSGGRPDMLCNPNGFGDAPGVVWNRACFDVPPAGSGRYGTASRGMLVLPQFVWYTGAFIFKKWNLAPMGMEPAPYFQAEAHIGNLFNHANPGGANTNITAAGFGEVRTSGWERRSIQIRLRVGF
jgi:hypothetical protein